MGAGATIAGAVGAAVGTATFNPPLAEYSVFVMNYIKQVIYMNKIERFLTFCNDHLKTIWRLSIIIYFVSSLLFILFHTPKYGYENVSGFEMFFFTIFPIVVIYSQKDLYKTTRIEKRNVALVYLTFLLVSIIELLVGVYSVFFGEISILVAVFISIAMIIACAVMTYGVFQLAFGNINLVLKKLMKIIQFYFNLYK